MRRAPLVLVALLPSLGVVGCRDSLGLRDLKFEARPTAAVEPPYSGGGGVDGGFVPRAFFTSFPMRVPDRFEVFPSTLGADFARFFLYDAKTGELSRYFGSDEQLQDESLEFASDQTFLGTSSNGEKTALFGYSKTTGFVSVTRSPSSAGETLEFETSAGTPGYTTLLLFDPPNFGAPKLFVHNETSGAFRFVAVPGTDDSSPPLIGTLSLEKVALSAWPDPSIPRVLAFAPSRNEISLWTLGEASVREASLVLPVPSTHAVAILSANGETGLLSYDANSGKVERFALVFDGTKLTATSEATAVWPASFTSLLLLSRENSFLAFNEESRVLARYSFDPLESSGSVIVK